MTASVAADRIAAGELSARDLTAACLARIAERDGAIKAFCHLDPERALAAARAVDRLPARSPLHGVPFAVKDVIDTSDLPTEYGTVIHRGRRPHTDAEAVARLRAAGAVMLGKTVTTEYAMFHPNATRHPENIDVTPGGSSSGSAAAVAAGMVPLAFANQTAGSLIRPAAFCGIYGLKPTHGTTPNAGILALQPRFDTLGYFARGLDDLIRAHSLVAQLALPAPWPDARQPRIGLCRSWQWAAAEPCARHALEESALRFATHAAIVEEFALPEDCAELVAVHRAVLYAGIARSLAEDNARARQHMSDALCAVIDEGRAVSAADYAAGLTRVERCRASVTTLFGAHDALISPSAPGEAPLGMATGNPIFQVTWTLLGVPVINLPVARGPRGLPLGIQLIGRPHDDLRLLVLAQRLMQGFVSFAAHG